MNPAMKRNLKSTWAVILAAGSGTRLAEAAAGVRKQYLEYQGRPLFWHSARTFSRIAGIKGFVFVFPPDDLEEKKSELELLFRQEELGLTWACAAGGRRRQDSVRNGLEALPDGCDTVLVHDSARPFVSASVVQSVIKVLENGAQGVIPVVPVKDTVKRVSGEIVVETLARGELRAVQTPQGFNLPTLIRAHELAELESWDVTDDASMVERIGQVATVPGEETNLKITTPEDLGHLQQREPDLVPCVGWGYDVHRYGSGRPFVLGGVPIPSAPEVVAHSDGDVLLHALTDALLGCLGKGDIGKHFPDTDEKYDGMSSSVFLKEALELARQSGLRIVHVDMTAIAQIPKLNPWRDQIVRNIAALIGLDASCVNFKATTEEGLGFTGEKKGIKAVATVTALKKG